MEKMVIVKLRRKVSGRWGGWFERRRISCFERFLEYLGEIEMIDLDIVFRESQGDF